jgi:hypothetical protein
MTSDQDSSPRAAQRSASTPIRLPRRHHPRPSARYPRPLSVVEHTRTTTVAEHSRTTTGESTDRLTEEAIEGAPEPGKCCDPRLGDRRTIPSRGGFSRDRRLGWALAQGAGAVGSIGVHRVERRSRTGGPAGSPGDDRSRRTYPTLPNYFAERHGVRSAEDAGLNLMSAAARLRHRTASPGGRAGRPGGPVSVLPQTAVIPAVGLSLAGDLRADPRAAAAVFADLIGRPVKGFAVISVRTRWCRPASESRRRSGMVTSPWRSTSSAASKQSGPRPCGAHARRDGIRHRRLLHSRRRTTSSGQRRGQVHQLIQPGARVLERYRTHLEALGQDEGSTQKLVRAGCNQVLRHVMLTDSLKGGGLVPTTPASG